MLLRIEGWRSRDGASRASMALLVASVGLITSGCSTDFRRLEQPSLAPGERSPLPSASLATRRNAGAPIGQETWSDSGARAPLPPVTAAPLPPPASPAPALPSTAGLSKPFDRPKAATPVAAPARAIQPSGQTIDVQPGDSLFAIAKRHNVSIADLMDANQLKSAHLKPGQKLALPASSSALRRPVAKQGTQVASAGSMPAAAVAAATEKPTAPQPAPSPGAAPVAASDWTGSYTLKPGDSLYAVARSHKVTLAELQRQNGIADATKVRQGVTLKVPGSGAPLKAQPVATAVVASAPRAAQIEATPSAPPSSSAVVTPKIINMQPVTPPAEPVKGEVAPIQPTPPLAGGPAPKIEPAPSLGASATKFRWPVKGPVLSAFGKRPDGTPNDGVAIAVPAGTDVVAASDGTVAYAGSELKAYGNLILVRHEGGWVTAYAHASEIVVKRGDTVKRGQVIAKSGQSGGVDKPQVHFELRKDSKPVDPTPHMEKI